MLKRLITSRVRIDLLEIFLLGPGEPQNARQLSSKIGAQYNAVWKELRNLEAAGLLLSSQSGNQRLYQLNADNPLLSALRSIFINTVFLGDRLREQLAPIENVHAVFVFGSFADGSFDQNSSVDLLILGDPLLTRIGIIISQLERALGRSRSRLQVGPIFHSYWKRLGHQSDGLERGALQGHVATLREDCLERPHRLLTTRQTKCTDRQQAHIRRSLRGQVGGQGFHHFRGLHPPDGLDQICLKSGLDLI